MRPKDSRYRTQSRRIPNETSDTANSSGLCVNFIQHHAMDGFRMSLPKVQRPIPTRTTNTRNAFVLSAWLVLVSIIPISGCTHLGSPEQMQDSANYPQNNSARTQIVSITGTVSPTLHLKMNAVYEGKVAADCWKSPLYSGGGLEGTAIPVRHTVPLALTADGEHFHGQFFADQFLPGKCGWHLHSVLAVLSKDGLPDNQVVIAQALERAMDSQYMDTSESPSFLHVKYLGGVSGWLLVLKKHEKSSQGIDNATHHIETNIIDESVQ